jgi:hypothetical protein
MLSDGTNNMSRIAPMQFIGNDHASTPEQRLEELDHRGIKRKRESQ